jgi:imidazolonepropionase-like amidohydrolase
MRYFGFAMRTLIVALVLSVCLILAGCQEHDVKVLIGATAVVAPGAQPIEDSVVVVAGGRIRSAGMRKDVPIPQDSERTDVSGKWIVPTEGGRLAINESADLLILDRAPEGVKPALPADVNRRMRNGQWQTKP